MAALEDGADLIPDSPPDAPVVVDDAEFKQHADDLRKAKLERFAAGGEPVSVPDWDGDYEDA